MNEKKVFLTGKEVEKILLCSSRTLLRLRQDETLSTYHIGARAKPNATKATNGIVYDADEVNALLIKRTTPTLITTEELK